MQRTLILLGLMLLVGVGSVFAQRGGGQGGGRPGGAGGGMGGNRPSQGMPSQGTGNGGNSQRTPNAGNRTGGQGQGEGGNSAERHQNRQMEPGRLLKGLDLSREQKQQIKEIKKTAQENGTSPEEVRSQISQVLTPEQKAKVQERIEKIKDRKGQGNGQNPPPNGQNPSQ
jgi:Spy/CpxP family protein refolding chaperone